MNVDALMVAVGVILLAAYAGASIHARIISAARVVDDSGLDILDADDPHFIQWEQELARTVSGPVDDADHLWLDPWGFVTPGGDQ